MRSFISFSLLILFVIPCFGMPNRAPWRAKVQELFRVEDARGAKFGEMGQIPTLQGAGIVFLKPGCPLADKYLPKLNRLSETLRDKGVPIIVVALGKNESVQTWISNRKADFLVVSDPTGEWLRHFEAEVSPEAFILDHSFEMVYRGMIDDQYLPGGIVKESPNSTPFRDTLEKVAAGNYVRPYYTSAQGCFLTRTTPSFNQDVAPVIYERCTICHRPGDIRGDIPLTSHAGIAEWAYTISARLEDGLMPPWAADHRFGHFSNDLGLSLNEERKIRKWIDADCPKDIGAEPIKPNPILLTSEWRIGEPDAVLSMLPKGEGYTVKPEGRLPYQHFIVESPFEEDKWVTATEVKPGASDVVHHINVFLLTEEKTLSLRELVKRRLGLKRLKDRGEMATPESVGMALDLYGWRLEKRVRFLSDYNPAESRTLFGEGRGFLLKKGARFVFEVHYTPNGVEQQDNSKIAFKFGDKVPEDWRLREPFTRIAGHMGRIQIPANQTFSLDYDLPFFLDADLQSLKPHMHYRGSSVEAFLVSPDGTEKKILSLPKWNYDFQMPYIFESPVFVPKGTTLRVRYHWDNTQNNPNLSQGEYSQHVDFGFQTEDEMSMAFPTFTYRSKDWAEVEQAEQQLTNYIENYVRLPK
jgi:hypothetical protein